MNPAASAPLTANPRELPGSLVVVCLALIALGVVAFVVGLSSDPATAWRAFHVNFLYFGMIAQAAIALASALVIVGARWPGPIRHVAEASPPGCRSRFVLFLVGNFFGREYIYTNWLHNPPPGKEGWLSFPRVFWTDASILGVGAAADARLPVHLVPPDARRRRRARDAREGAVRELDRRLARRRGRARGIASAAARARADPRASSTRSAGASSPSTR